MKSVCDVINSIITPYIEDAFIGCAKESIVLQCIHSMDIDQLYNTKHKDIFMPTVTARIPEELDKELIALAEETDRPKEYIIKKSYRILYRAEI